MSLPVGECMTARAVVRDTGPRGLVEIELVDAPRCRGCEGSCLWRRMPRAQRLELHCAKAVAVGDAVTVSLPAHYVLVAALMLYGVPLAGLLAGALGGALVGSSDLAVLLGAVAGVALASVAAPSLKRRVEAGTLAQLRLHSSP